MAMRRSSCRVSGRITSKKKANFPPDLPFGATGRPYRSLAFPAQKGDLSAGNLCIIGGCETSLTRAVSCYEREKWAPRKGRVFLGGD